MRLGRRHHKQDEAQIDLTSMLDIVFIMLIFFIVTASFIKEPGVEVNRPEATTWDEKKNAAILIALDQKSEIWIDKNKVDPRNVRSKIETLHAENPKGTVVIQADDKANVETIAKVVEAAKKVGIVDVAVATERK